MLLSQCPTPLPHVTWIGVQMGNCQASTFDVKLPCKMSVIMPIKLITCWHEHYGSANRQSFHNLCRPDACTSSPSSGPTNLFYARLIIGTGYSFGNNCIRSMSHKTFNPEESEAHVSSVQPFCELGRPDSEATCGSVHQLTVS